MLSKDIKKIICFILLLLGGFALVTYVGNVLIIGEKIGNITHSFVEVFIDVLFIFGPLVFVIWKIKKDVLKYRFVCFDNITDLNASREQLDDFLSMLKECKDQENLLKDLNLALQSSSTIDKNEFIKKYIKECDEKVTAAGFEIAFLAAISVLISSQRVTDTLGMLFWNFRIISKILAVYGVRPSLSALIKLYCNVLFSALLVGSIEEVLDNFDMPVTSKIPFVSPLTQAIATIYACLRTVKLTQYYLQHGVNANRINADREAREFAGNNLAEVWRNEAFQRKIKELFNSGIDIFKDRAYAFWSNLFGGIRNRFKRDSNFV